MRFNVYLALWLAVVLNVMFYKQVQLLTPYHGFKAYAFIGATVLVVLAFYHLVFQLLQWRPMAKGLAALLIIIGGMSAVFCQQFRRFDHTRLDPKHDANRWQ